MPTIYKWLNPLAVTQERYNVLIARPGYFATATANPGDGTQQVIPVSAGTLTAYEMLTRKGAASGYAGLDGSAKLSAANMRPYVDRGAVTASTSYNVWDSVVLAGRRVVITAATTSSSTKFISAANYVPIGPATWFNVKDFGAKGDASTDDTAAIQAGIDACATVNTTFGGGTLFFPAGMYITSATLTVKKHVWLRGEGQNTSTIKLAANSNCHVVQNEAAASGAGANADCIGLVDMCFDGNAANQNGAGPYHSVYLTTNPVGTVAAGDSFFDMHHTVMNVRAYRPKGNGFHFIGRSAIQVINALAYNPIDYGFYSTFDTNYSHCESDGSGKSGFYINNSSIRITASKSYLSGQIDGVGAGFEFSSNANGVVLAGCEAQNNKGPGFQLNGANRCVIGGVADSNNLVSANSYSAVELNNASYNIINVSCWQGSQSVGQVGYQRTALRLYNGSNYNSITLSHSALAGLTISTALTGDSVLAANTVVVNGSQQSGASHDGLFGDASDGSAVLDGTNTVTWATKSGSVYTMVRNAFCSSVSVSSGVTVLTKGFFIFATSTITNAGTISGDGVDATSTTQTASNGNAGYGGGGQTAVGTAGQIVAFGAGNGGNGGTGSSGAGGTGGGKATGVNAVRVPYAVMSNVIGVFGATYVLLGGPGGGGGGGDGTNKGGAGGSGGSPIFLVAPQVTNSGVLTAKGGAGYTPTVGNVGGGGGGAGGNIVVYTNTAWTNTGTTPVTGGAAGAGFGTGTAGGAGATGTLTNVVLP